MRRKGWQEGTLPPECEVIPNGIELDRFYRPAPPPDAPPPINLLIAGRITADKGVATAVEAVARLAQRRPRDFHLLIAGAGPNDYRAKLDRMIRENNLGGHVTFLGRLPRSDIPALMHRCHIFLLPTDHDEPFARVMLEAMAAGLAVIGTLTGGTGELLIHERNGLAFAAADSADLACQIERLLDNPGLRYQLASQGQKDVVGHYSLDLMVDRLEGLLRRAIAGGD
jgi:glycosyltransferase involved in cell wall biosynthesis